MKNFYVNLRDGTTDAEFQVVLDLLKEHRGYREEDGRDYRQVKQPDGTLKEQGFLYLFDDRADAETFRDKVRERTKNPAWQVVEVEVEPIEEMIEEHRLLRDEPLLLAMYYDAGENPGDACLLEVIDNFGANGIDPDRELFKMTLASNPSFPILTGQKLHMILTNPREFETAVRESWDEVIKIRRAVRFGRYKTFFTTEGGDKCLELVHG